MKLEPRAVGLLFCSPAFLLLTFAVVIPFFVAAGITFTDQRLLSPNPTRLVGLENYRRLLSIAVVELPRAVDETGRPLATDGEPVYESLRERLRSDPALRYHRRLLGLDFEGWSWVVVARDPVFYRSLFNTFVFAALVIPLQCGTALGLALLVNRRAPGRTFFRALLFSPVVTSMVVIAVVWTFLYQPRAGVMTALVRFLSGGLIDEVPWLGSELLALPSIVLMSAWQGAGFQMLIFLAGLQSIDRSLYEAARLDGATRWQQFRHVTLPGLRNTTVFVVISTTIAAFGLFTQVDVMTAGGPGDATSTLIYHAVRTGFREQDVAYGSTVAVVFFVLVLAVALLQRRLTREGPE